MTENKRTDYSKVKRKTEPTTVRFDSEQLIFIQKREPLLKSKQMVLDFLLDAYCRTYKVQPSNPFEQPPIHEGSNQSVQKIEPIAPLRLETPPISQYDVYLKEIQDATWSGDLEMIMVEAKKDVSPQQYSRLQLIAIEHAKSFVN